MVETGADTQVRRITEMEWQLGQIARATGNVATEAARRVSAGQKLMQEYERLQERFKVLEVALADDRALLTGATTLVDRLITAADKSGRTFDRRIADAMVDELKLAAEQLHLGADRLAQEKLRTSLEFTLLQGLQSRATNVAGDIEKVNSDQAQLAKQVKVQRAAADKLASGLLENRRRLSERSAAFSRSVEKFRVVQVAVLRRWLIDGPPAGETPSLSISDVQEGIAAKSLGRPDPSLKVLGPQGGEKPLDAVETMARFSDRAGGAGGVVSDDDLNQASAELITLHKRSRWYLAMLSRLTSFVAESMAEAASWESEVDAWRSELITAGRFLAEQQGSLTSLRMEQDLVSTTLALISTQGEAAQTQVAAMASDVEEKTKRLDGISAELAKLAAK
jgi:chromosome segregation ATPase